MAGNAKKEGFTSRPEVLAMLPETSGNALNGMGEDAVRRPTPIMWHPPHILPHGELQEWFLHVASAPGAIEWRKINREFRGKGLSEIARDRPDWTPEEWTRHVKQAALAREAEFVGITRMDPSWVFEGYEAPYEWMVVMAVGMDYEKFSTAPSHDSQTETQTQYARCTRAAYKLANWMREHGWEAEPHGGPDAGPVIMIPGAIQAGLGELGKHGSMIHRELGSTFRLSCVLTDMPLVADQPAEFGADDFCASCNVCSRACPIDAIHDEKQLVRGEKKWYVDFDACFRFFVENYGCGICIAQCPWSRPGTAPRLAEKMTRRKGRERG